MGCINRNTKQYQDELILANGDVFEADYQYIYKYRRTDVHRNDGETPKLEVVDGSLGKAIYLTDNEQYSKQFGDIRSDYFIDSDDIISVGDDIGFIKAAMLHSNTTKDSKEIRQKYLNDMFAQGKIIKVSRFNKLNPKNNYLIENKSQIYTPPTNKTEPQFQKLSPDEQNQYVANEQTIRDLAARMSARTGIPYTFESDRTKEYKGYNENDSVNINLAFAGTDTIFHEFGHSLINAIRKTNPTLYANLIKEVNNSEKGRSILERVKRDYVYKEGYKPITTQDDVFGVQEFVYRIDGKTFNNENDAKKYQKENPNKILYTEEEQFDEALNTLLGELSAEKLDKIKDKGLIAILKQLLKEMTEVFRSLFTAKEVDITKNLDNIEQLTNDKIKEFIKNGIIDKNCG